MRLAAMTPMLVTTQMTETIRWYTSLLDFECVGVFGDSEHPDWCHLKHGDINLYWSGPMEGLAGPALSGSLYFTPDDVMAWWERLKDQVTIEWEPTEFEYGMLEFGIRDPNGIILNFGQDIEEAKTMRK